MKDGGRNLAGIVAFLVIIAAAAWFALDKLEAQYPEAARSLKRTLLQGFGLAIAAAIGLFAMAAAPWWIAAAAAGSVLVATGAWKVAADVLELPQLGGGSDAPSSCAAGTAPDGTVCLDYQY